MRLPAEWEPQERTLMGWPCRLELWGETIDQARAEYAATANAIADFEPVTMLANPGADAARARAMCAESVEVVELPLDDSWLRDCGPIYVRDDAGGRIAVHFRFNAWGEKFSGWERDAEAGRLAAEALGDEVITAPIVLEGGSILSDGAGTLLTTEQCLLHPNRNPSLDRAQIEAVLIEFLGVERIVWLGRGLIEDRDTDGHIDLIASFTGPRRALLQTVPADNLNRANCEDNLRRLEDAEIDVIDFPFLPYAEVAGETVAVSYLNFFICNGAVIVPVSGARTDSDALGLIAQAFGDREVVTVPGVVLAYGGGGPHCITQQVPVPDG
ncbi:MAG TPA: agmatine deiminase family protein [Solirubrobacteraceae bacterium]